MATKTQTPPTLDYSNKDYASLVTVLLELASDRLPEWTDRSPNDPGVMLVELFAAMGDMLFYNQDRIAAEAFLGTARERRSVLHLLRLIGYELRPPAAASADLTLLFEGTATGNVTIKTAQEFRTSKEATGTPVSFRYLREDITIDRGALEQVTLNSAGELVKPLPSTPAAKVFTVYRTLPVVQVDFVVDKEILGSSDGSPGQRMSLARAPLIDGSLALTIDEGVPTLWSQVPSLLDSKATDLHYAVQRDEKEIAWIAFGDGTHGKIPRRGRNNIAASYLVGGGAKGNVASRTISKAVPEIDKLKRIMNEGAASGGTDPEATADAIMRGPQQNRSMGRAVTAADYEAHARMMGVAKVRASAPGWNRIDLVVAPAGGGIPTDTLKRDLRAYFDSKRMLTTQVEIVDPVYVDIVIEGELTVDPRYFNSQVQQRVEAVMLALWSFADVDFGETLYLSKIYEAIETVEGVEAVNIKKFWRSDTSEPAAPALAIPTEGKIELGPHVIPNVRGITLTRVEGGRTDG